MAEAPAEPLTFGPITADLDTHHVQVGGQKVSRLKLRRFELLCLLMRQEGPLDRREILRSIWPDSDYPGLVEVTIYRLRKDLKEFSNIEIEATPKGYLLVVKG